jgi:3-dehydroquinate synthase
METIERLHVDLGDRGYDILVGPQLIERAGREMLPLMRRRHLVIVSDEIVAGHYLAALRDSLSEAGVVHHTVLLPPGEETKDLAHFGKLAEDILTIGIERGSMLVALGGGVVGDVTGFAAATLLRGIDFVQIPTTLLAQVDSSVGGKTGINTRTGKNLIGAFYQPRLVLADTSVLTSLPRRELLAGYAEIVKYGLIRDAEFFVWLEADGHQVCALAPGPLRRAVLTSCSISATPSDTPWRPRPGSARACFTARRWRWAWFWRPLSPQSSALPRRRTRSGCAAISKTAACRREWPRSG